MKIEEIINHLQDSHQSKYSKIKILKLIKNIAIYV